MEINSKASFRAQGTTLEARDAPGGPPRQVFAGLKRRADYLRVAKGVRVHAATLSLQAASRTFLEDPALPTVARFGLTVTKKVGGAVERNRIRRRLREALRQLPSLAARADHDYVVLARREALTAAFPALVGELAQALRRVHEPRRHEPRHKAKRPPAVEPPARQLIPGLAVRPTDLDTLQSAARPALDSHERFHDAFRDTDQ